jgi:prepilin-type N-terminal cleavage/methylation domain-containing protein
VSTVSRIQGHGSANGFTLIELIAVIVLLGILLALAVPRFQDLQKDTGEKALQSALAEGMATMSLSYAKLMLSAGEAATPQIAAYASLNPPASDDFSYSFSSNGLVTVSGKAGSRLSGLDARTRRWSK